MSFLVTTSPVSSNFQLSSSGYESSNSGIDNIQASQPISGPAVVPGTSSCLRDAKFKANAESMIAIDPVNPSHLVGASHFIYGFQPGGGSFAGSVGVHASTDGGLTWSNQIIPGFDCLTSAKSRLIYRTYDPVIAFDDVGSLYAAILPDTSPNAGANLPLYVTKSTDGVNWNVANGGMPVFVAGSSAGSADKQWIIVDNYRSSPFFGSIYVVWVAFHGYGNSDILLSKSTDSGQTFSKPIQVSPSQPGTIGFAWPIPALAPDGTLYVNFIKYISCSNCNTLDEMVAKSTDGGNTFGSPSTIASKVLWHIYPYPNTVFRDGIYQSFTVNPANGNLLLALENAIGGYCYGPTGQCYGVVAADTNILLYESTDGGLSWNQPITVNDDSDEPTNQFQPVVAASPSGLVAVAFYDRRLACPSGSGIKPNDVGKKNICIDTSIQFFTDMASLSRVGQNIRATKSNWDPNNAGTLGKGKDDKLPFIGDYFGLALTNTMAYALFTANFDLGGNPTYDMQAIVARIKAPVNLATTTTSVSTEIASTQPVSTGVTTASASTSEQSAAGPFGIPGFGWGSILIGLACGVVVLALRRRNRIWKKG